MNIYSEELLIKVMEKIKSFGKNDDRIILLFNSVKELQASFCFTQDQNEHNLRIPIGINTTKGELILLNIDDNMERITFEGISYQALQYLQTTKLAETAISENIGKEE